MAPGGGRAGSEFVGRVAELTSLEKSLAEALAGRGRLSLVAGEPGIGKTRLADELATRAATAGARVLWGRCWEGDATPPYWPWTQIIRSYVQSTTAEQLEQELGNGAEDVASIVPELGRKEVGAGVDAANFGDARFRLFDSTALFFMRAAARQPLVLLLDDMHSADESSLLLLHFCARELRNARILLLCTYRDAEVRLQPALASQFADLAREGRRLLLSGWDSAQVEESLRHRGDPSVPPQLAPAIHRLTEGNPFFVDEIVRELKGGRLDKQALLNPSPALSVPDGVRQTIRARLESLPGETSELLALAAVIGREFDTDLLRHVRGLATQSSPLSFADSIAMLRPAATAGLAAEVPGSSGRFAFSHALVRETLSNELATAQRITLHRQVGEALESADAAPAVLAYHFFHAAPAGGAEKAVHYSRLAGDEAQRRAAYEDAAAYYQQGLDALRFLSCDDALRSELLIALGHAQQRAGRIPEARDAFRRATSLARDRNSPETVARAVLGFGLVGETGVVDAELVDYLRDALRRIGEQETPARARLQARLAMGLYFSTDPGDRERRDRLSLEALDAARRLGDSGALAAALIARHFVLWGPSNTETRLQLSAELERVGVETGNLEIEVEARTWRAVDLLENGDGPGFVRERDGLAAAAGRLRMPLHLWHVEVLNSLWALARGDSERAELNAAAAKELGENNHVGRALQFFAAQMFFIRRHQARLIELEPAVRAYAEHMDAVPVWKCGLALLYADLDRLFDAQRALDVALATDPSEWPADGNLLPGLALLAEVCAVVGARGHAARLHELLLPYAGKHVVLFDGIALLGPVSHYLGLLAATLGDDAAAATHLHQALASSDALGTAGLSQKIRDAIARLKTSAPPSVGTLPADGHRMTFRSEGAYWNISFGGISGRIRHSRGLFYVAYLLRHAGNEFHALDLAAAATGAPESAGRKADLSTADGGSLRLASGAADDVLDAQARSEYRERLRDLQEELAEAEENNDLGRVELLQEEMNAIAAELSRALGLGGRARATSSDGERARVAVTKAVIIALKAIGEQNAPLQKYLERTIKTGAFCSYSGDPQEAKQWDLGDA